MIKALQRLLGWWPHQKKVIISNVSMIASTVGCANRIDKMKMSMLKVSARDLRLCGMWFGTDFKITL
jgi:hypothetical protein